MDEAGALYKVVLPEGGTVSKGAVISRLLDFHAGGIVGMHLSASAHVAVTAGADGSVRVWDYAAASEQLLHTLRFSGGATAVAQVGGPEGVDAVAGSPSPSFG